MCIVYLQLELEAWRSGRGRQQSGEYRDSEDPHSAKGKFQRKTETQNSLKTGAIPITTSYLSVLYALLYFYVLSFYLSLLKLIESPFILIRR